MLSATATVQRDLIMRLGILGGTFDPVHYGHLLMAEICRQELQLDQVRLIPAGNPPHKPETPISEGTQRATMLTLAVAGCPEFVVDRRELLRQGPSWTVLTLSELRKEYPTAELYFLMGADSLRDIPTWREPERIAELATLVACNRPGLPLPTVAQAREWTSDTIASRVHFVQIPGIDLSATQLRERVRRGLGLRFMTPRAVAAYIEQHALYRSANSGSVLKNETGSPDRH